MYFSNAIVDDGPELVRLINSAYRLSGSKPGWTDERQLLSGPRISSETIGAEFVAGRFLLCKTTHDGPIAGCVHIAVLENQIWYIALLAVDPTNQAKGIGADLLTNVEQQAIAASADCLRITVIKQRQQLIAWYERRGFRLNGKTIPFPYDDSTVGVPLRPDLSLVVLEKKLAP
ncbi:N-acetyltransferase [Neorhizobium sp. AL 9.2.2]|uniref:GNAT family N-acetyltransferase n=1 Tax=Neorhizobium sp. AL 9.2.2 TaxID=2712894 RepID=UPI0013AE8BC8|nr:GNAT family N-acetyltransferase [Neorhizobium sp. AL 9.2.2]NSY20169.1 GNAT family N-acetyltransferase [Neorhizobium sp. AL 9.2.2]